MSLRKADLLLYCKFILKTMSYYCDYVVNLTAKPSASM